MRKKDVYLVINATDKCNRGCSHCMFDSKPSGNSFFTPEMAEVVIEEVSKFDEKIKIHFCITGGGEPLMNPDLVKIFDVFFASKKIRHARILTSGFLSKDTEEANLLGQLTKRPYAGKIDFTLSFNEFNATFIERCKNSLLLICKQKRPRYISINLAISNETTLTTYKKVKEVFDFVSENVRKEDTFTSGIYLYSLDHDQYFLQAIANTDFLTKTLYGREEFISILSVSYLCDAYYAFYSMLYKNKNLRIIPFTIKRLGRAENLDDGINDFNFCSFIFQKKESHLIKMGIDSAGNFYPNSCFDKKGLRIGKLGVNGLKEIIEKRSFLKMNILNHLITDQMIPENNNICDLCQKVVAEKLS